MKSIRKLSFVLIIVALLLSACQQATPTQAPQVEPPAQVEPTQPPAPTTAPTQPPAPTDAPAQVEPTQPPAPTDEPAPAGLTCEDTIKVGLITDASGPLAVYGAHILRSFMLGMEYGTGAEGSVGPVFQLANSKTNTFELEGCEIEVIVVDDGSNPENTGTLARELIEVEEVDFLVGTVSSGATAVLQGIAMENKIPLIVAPAAANDITGVNFNEYTFRTSRTNYHDAINVCEYMAKDLKTFVQIAPDYAFGWGGAAAFRDACTFYGGEFVADDIFAPAATTDFTPYMEQISDSGAEAWIVTWAGGGFIPMMQAAEDLGVADEMQMGTAFIDNISMPAFFSGAVGQTSGILYHFSGPQNNPINEWMIEQTRSRYGVSPDLFDADGFNAALMLLEALKATGGSTDSAALIEAMEGMEFEGPKGLVYIRPEDHVAIQDMYIVKLVNVTDPQAAFYEYVSTTRPEPPCLLPEALQSRCGDLPVGSLSGK